MIDQKYLDEFRYFGDRIYLDCSAMGMIPQRTRDLAKRHIDLFYDSLWRDPEIQGEVIREKARAAVARLIHADPADIFFTRNTTEGNNLLAQGYPLNPGDEVLLCNEDYPSVYLPWAVRQREGIRLTVINGQNGFASADDFIAHFSNKTRVVAVSMVQSSSGYCIDLSKLGNACRERGILLSVDAVQAAGRLPIDVDAMKVDVLASAGFKGLMGIMGAGFCWCRREALDCIEPFIVSENIDWNSIDVQQGFERLDIPVFQRGYSRMEAGTTNNLGIAMMAESISMLNEIGIENIAAQIRSVETRYRRRLRELSLPVQMLGSDDPSTWSGSVSFRYDLSRKHKLADALNEAGIFVSVRDYLRAGFHFYNTGDQADSLISALKEALL